MCYAGEGFPRHNFLFIVYKKYVLLYNRNKYNMDQAVYWCWIQNTSVFY